MKMKINRPLVVFAAGLLLVAGSSIGATRATLTYSAAGEEVDYSTAKMNVELLQNGDKITKKTLRLPKKFEIGIKYDEDISVKNTSSNENYKEFIRVTVKRSWKQAEDMPLLMTTEDREEEENSEEPELTKDTSLNPDNIDLGIEKGWILDESDSKNEQLVYYYYKAISPQEKIKLINSIKVKNEVWDDITVWQFKNEDAVDDLVNEYRYDNKYVSIEVQADAVQAKNAEDAMLGAWGVDAEVEVIEDPAHPHDPSHTTYILKSINGSTEITE